jgi:glycosyltransferase involved in cell wall biosynthesis
MTTGSAVRIGVDGRVFHVNQPGGDASVGMKHAELLLKNVEDVRVYGHRQLSSHYGQANVVPAGMVSTSLLFGLAWEQTALPIISQTDNLDVLYSPNSYCPLVPTSYECVVAIQDIPSYHGYGSRRYRQFRKTILPVVARRADRVITVSEYSRKDIGENLGVPVDKISVVYNGINDMYFGGQSTKPEFDLPDRYLLYVGAKSERKNVRGVLEAFGELKREYDTGHKLVLVGPHENPTYDPLTIDSSDVIVPDYLREPELKYVYEAADVFLFPSYHESFGLPVVEAAACETPVVTTDRGAIPEVIGNHAEFVNPDEPKDIAQGVINLLTDEAHAEELIAGAGRRAERYRWRDQIGSLIDAVVGV